MLQEQNPVMIGMASVPTAPLFLHCKVKLTGCETSKAGLETICSEQATRLPNANWALSIALHALHLGSCFSCFLSGPTTSFYPGLMTSFHFGLLTVFCLSRKGGTSNAP